MRDHPDRELVDYIHRAFSQGFRVGFERSQLISARRNMRSVLEHSGVIHEYVELERQKGRVLGPFLPGECISIRLG